MKKSKLNIFIGCLLFLLSLLVLILVLDLVLGNNNIRGQWTDLVENKNKLYKLSFSDMM